MKKIFLFMSAASFLAATSMAQNTTTKKKGNWGIKTGLNISNIRVENGADSDWKGGLALGAFFSIKAGDKFSIQPEFLYSSMGGKNLVGATDASLRLNYFSLPVMGRFQIKKSLALLLGPQVDILIQAKTKSNNNGLDKVTDNYREYSFNGTAGFEWWPLECLGLSTRYIYGFTDINLSSVNSGGGNAPDATNQGIQIMAAIKL